MDMVTGRQNVTTLVSSSTQSMVMNIAVYWNRMLRRRIKCTDVSEHGSTSIIRADMIMEAAEFSETSIHFYQTIWSHFSGHSIIQSLG